MIPAIFCHGKVVTGLHHGEAFSKLNEQEKNSEELLSGFIDNLKFVCDDRVIYLKEIILIRHAQSHLNMENGPITDIGKKQACQVADFLQNMNLKGYTGFTSPYLRCQQTSRLLKENCHIPFTTHHCLSKKSSNEDNANFRERMSQLLEFLPEKSVLITHCDLIQNILALTNLISEHVDSINNCSVTYIFKNRLIWLAKDITGVKTT